ncbi:MAG: hypothetical protein ABI600_11700 [Luteolibacter sp.]
MKNLILSTASFLALMVPQMTVRSSAQEEVTQGGNAEITGAIADGKPSPPAIPPVLPDFKVKSTVARELDVVEPPPMSGLPPVTGTITEMVHLVEDPKLPDPPPPPVVTDSEVSVVLAEAKKKYREARCLFLSATVYDHSRTLLRCYTSGNLRKEITAWSNLDFNYYSGFSNFKVKGAAEEIRAYNIMDMGVGNEDTAKWAKLTAKYGAKYKAPKIPSLPDGDPAYLIVSENPDEESVQIMEDLHQLYRNEGPRMKEAYLAREKAYAERYAYLLANPPVPEDVVIHFWKRQARPAVIERQEGEEP